MNAGRALDSGRLVLVSVKIADTESNFGKELKVLSVISQQ
jgi:hypothetical protein